MQSLFVGLRRLHSVELHNLAEPRVRAAIPVCISERLPHSLHQSWVEWRIHHSNIRRLRLLSGLLSTTLYCQLANLVTIVYNNLEFCVTNQSLGRRRRYLCFAGQIDEG